MSRPGRYLVPLLAAMLGLSVLGLASARTGEAGAGVRPQAGQAAVRFGYVDVFIDSGSRGLAVYQVELRATSGDVRLVGVEGGDPAAFADPPRYDPAALIDGERIIIGAFSVLRNLPQGKNRVARIHVRMVGPSPEFVVSLQVAGDRSADEIDAVVSTALRSDS